MNDILTDIINNSKNEKLVERVKQWLNISNKNVDYEQSDTTLQILSPNWEREVLGNRN